MWPLSFIVNTVKKSQAAIIVQNLLTEIHASGHYAGIPARDATLLVYEAWHTSPEIFDGRSRPRPSKFSIALAAIAQKARLSDSTDPNLLGYLICMGKVLEASTRPIKPFPVNKTDAAIVMLAATAYPDMMNARRSAD